MRHAVIMAGGSGTRLWPLSRRHRPKQLLRIFEGRSLLRRSFERLHGLLGAEHIYVITGRDHLPAVADELPELPAKNLIGEPCPRDTANAVGLAAHLLARKDPEGTMGVFTADHIIEPVDVFRETVARGFETAERYDDALVTFGIKPETPHTGYGYVHRGRRIEQGVYEVIEFKEKPDQVTAERYLASGEYYWNSGMFAWRLPTIIGQIAKHQPAIDAGLRRVAEGFDDPCKVAEVLAAFSQLHKISIDFAVMEKADRVITVEMPCTWLDVGSWTALADIFAPDQDGNIRAARNVASLDASGNILVSESEHLIAAIGVRDLVIVHAEDATLVCTRREAQRVRELVERLKTSAVDRYT